MPWSGTDHVDASCDNWSPSSGGYPNSGWSNQRQPRNNWRPAGCPNPQAHGYTEECSLNHQNQNPSLFSRIMSKIRPPPNKCPLNPQTTKVSGGVSRTNCFSQEGSSKNPSNAFDSLDNLWNPRKIRRWGCVDNWDQHKESQWKQVGKCKALHTYSAMEMRPCIIAKSIGLFRI